MIIINGFSTTHAILRFQTHKYLCVFVCVLVMLGVLDQLAYTVKSNTYNAIVVPHV